MTCVRSVGTVISRFSEDEKEMEPQAINNNDIQFLAARWLIRAHWLLWALMSTDLGDIVRYV